MNHDKNGNEIKTGGLLKISEVAEAADSSVSTVKFYVREGLIDIACKTGKNMAYYAPESVEKVKLIRTLQSEKYYPLAVIKHMLRNGEAGFEEVQLLDTINKADREDYYEQVTIAEAAKEAGLKPREADALVHAGLVVPVMSGRTKMCCRGELRVMKLAKRRMDAGIPLEQTIEAFSMYESYLRESTKKDIESLVRGGLLKKDLSTEDIMDIINVSDETLDSFIGMKRYAMNASLGAVYIAKTELLLSSLENYGRGISSILTLLGYVVAAEDLKSALDGRKTTDGSLAAYGEILKLDGTGLARTLTVLHKAGVRFDKAARRTGCNDTDMTHDALRLGWLTFAPEEFGCEPIKAREEFIRNTEDKSFTESVLQLIDGLRNKNM